MKQRQYEARVSRFTKQQQWGDNVSGEAIEMVQVQVESQ